MEFGKRMPVRLAFSGLLLTAAGCGVTHVPDKSTTVHHVGEASANEARRQQLDNLGAWAARMVTARALDRGRQDRDAGKHDTVAHQLLQSSKSSSKGGLSMVGVDDTSKNRMRVDSDGTDRNPANINTVDINRHVYSMDGGILIGKEQSVTITKFDNHGHWQFIESVDPDGPLPAVGAVIGGAKEPLPEDQLVQGARILVHFAMRQAQYVQRQS